MSDTFDPDLAGFYADCWEKRPWATIIDGHTFSRCFACHCLVDHLDGELVEHPEIVMAVPRGLLEHAQVHAMNVAVAAAAGSGHMIVHEAWTRLYGNLLDDEDVE